MEKPIHLDGERISYRIANADEWPHLTKSKALFFFIIMHQLVTWCGRFTAYHIIVVWSNKRYKNIGWKASQPHDGVFSISVLHILSSKNPRTIRNHAALYSDQLYCWSGSLHTTGFFRHTQKSYLYVNNSPDFCFVGFPYFGFSLLVSRPRWGQVKYTCRPGPQMVSTFKLLKYTRM